MKSVSPSTSPTSCAWGALPGDCRQGSGGTGRRGRPRDPSCGRTWVPPHSVLWGAAHRTPHCGRAPGGEGHATGDTPGLLSGPVPTPGLPGPGGWGGRGRCPQSTERSGSPPRGAPGFPAEAHRPVSPRARASPGAGPLVAVPVLEPEAEPSRDIILVGSSKPAPGSCRPRRGRGEAPGGRIHPGGCGPGPTPGPLEYLHKIWKPAGAGGPPTPARVAPGPSTAFTRESQAAEGTGVRSPFAGVGAYEVQVDRRDIEGERGPGEGGRAAPSLLSLSICQFSIPLHFPVHFLERFICLFGRAGTWDRES